MSSRRKTPPSLYEQYLLEIGVISINVGDVDPVFGEKCVSEFGIEYIQVDDVATLVTTKGVVFTDAEV